MSARSRGNLPHDGSSMFGMFRPLTRGHDFNTKGTVAALGDWHTQL